MALPMRTVTLICALLLGLGLAQAAAQDERIRIETRPGQTSNGKPAAELVVNGQVVARIAKEQNGKRPLRTVSNAANKLAGAYRAGRLELASEAAADARDWILLLNGKPLLLATDLEAKAWGVSPKTLAQGWLKNINAALAGVVPATPPPSTHLVKAPAPAPKPAQSAAKPMGSGGVVQQDYNVLGVGLPSRAEPRTSGVMDHTPKLPAGAIITGNNPGQDVVRPAVDAALRYSLKLGAGTPLIWQLAPDDPSVEATKDKAAKTSKAKAEPPKPKPIALKPGESRKVKLAYTAGGTPGTTMLTVQNRPIQTPRETLTLFSNSPESMYRTQLLYEAELPAGRAARLVYHHQNQTHSGMRFIVRALADYGESALHVIPGTVQADINTFYVGFRSAENYWTNLNAGNGYASPLAADGQLVLLSQELGSGLTSSGYMKLTNIGDSPLRLEVLTLPTGSSIPGGSVSPHESTTRCVFDAPYFSEDDIYSVGDPWLYLRLGEGRPESSTDDTILHGCYGMTHTYNVELRNPTGNPALIFVLLRGSAGEVKGQFYINDQYISTPLVAGGDEHLLQEIPLPPGKTKLLKVKAIALNGGFYPASVVVRETRYP
jgi:hypothetical protein